MVKNIEIWGYPIYAKVYNCTYYSCLVINLSREGSRSLPKYVFHPRVTREQISYDIFSILRYKWDTFLVKIIVKLGLQVFNIHDSWVFQSCTNLKPLVISFCPLFGRTCLHFPGYRKLSGRFKERLNPLYFTLIDPTQQIHKIRSYLH